MPKKTVDVASINRDLVDVQWSKQQYSTLVLDKTDFNAFYKGQSILFIFAQPIQDNNYPQCHFHHSPISFDLYSCTRY